jgi:hypothetical protein
MDGELAAVTSVGVDGEVAALATVQLFRVLDVAEAAGFVRCSAHGCITTGHWTWTFVVAHMRMHIHEDCAVRRLLQCSTVGRCWTTHPDHALDLLACGS